MENQEPEVPPKPVAETPLMTLTLFLEGKGYRASVDFPEEHNLLDTIRILEAAIYVLKGTKDKFLSGEAGDDGEFFDEND